MIFLQLSSSHTHYLIIDNHLIAMVVAILLLSTHTASFSPACTRPYLSMTVLIRHINCHMHHTYLHIFMNPCRFMISLFNNVIYLAVMNVNQAYAMITVILIISLSTLHSIISGNTTHDNVQGIIPGLVHRYQRHTYPGLET